MRVLLTGHDGYIGSVAVPFLLKSGFDVTGLDCFYFHECLLGSEGPSIPVIRKDIRDLTADDVRGFDAVVHLAALSNDPIGNLNEGWTKDINTRATVRLAELAKSAGCRRFLFSSSCIMYGMSDTEWVNETVELAPQTEYARSKVECERGLQKLADDSFSPAYLRNGTVYGLSPRMRLDTVLNNFVSDAVTKGKVTVFSDGKPWRPVVHVYDLVRTFEVYLRAPLEVIHNQAFNNGANALNYQIGRLAEVAVAAAPGAELEILAKPGADQRTYKADFSKFADTFPNFVFDWTPETGAKELAEAFARVKLSEDDIESGRYVRLRWLNHLMDSNRLDDQLRWSN